MKKTLKHLIYIAALALCAGCLREVVPVAPGTEPQLSVRPSVAGSEAPVTKVEDTYPGILKNNLVDARDELRENFFGSLDIFVKRQADAPGTAWFKEYHLNAGDTGGVVDPSKYDSESLLDQAKQLLASNWAEQGYVTGEPYDIYVTANNPHTAAGAAPANLTGLQALTTNDPQIFRNHNYVLDIFGIPWEGLGYASFDDAVNSVTYANNQTVTISETVPTVNDGRYQLSIIGDTYLIYQDPALVNTTQTVYFEYKAMVSGESTSGVTADSFKAAWNTDIRSSFASDVVTVTTVSNDGTTYKGAISITLGTTINSALQGGQIELKDKLTGMTRFLNIYTIDQFNYLPQGSTGLKLIKTGGSRVVNGVSCDTYKMDIRIPGDYPLGLYPIKIRMASITLNPYMAEQRSSGSTTLEETEPDIAVEMNGTENGSRLDGEILSGMSFSTTGSAWNYRATGEPWDFWYIDTILNKPTTEEEGETVIDERDKVYTIYFDDIRPIRAAANRASNVGLFVKIKYFGPAVALEY